MAKMKTLTVNGKTYTVEDPDSVSFENAQDLTEAQKLRARENIGAASIGDTAVGAAAWSGRNIVDRLCPGFSERGAVVTCNPVEGYPLEAVSQIAPAQAGSGDPYPPGGGRNLISQDAIEEADEQTLVICENEPIALKAGTYYTFSIDSSVKPDYIFFMNHDTGGQLYNEPGVQRITYDCYEDVKVHFVVLWSGGIPDDARAAVAKVKLEVGTAATPYSNIRPITGHTGCKLWRGGKNLLDVKQLKPSTSMVNAGSITVSNDEYTVAVTAGGAWASAQCSVVNPASLAGRTVYLKADAITSAQSDAKCNVSLIMIGSSKTTYADVKADVLSKEITIPKDIVTLRIGIYPNNSGTELASPNTVTVKGLRLSLDGYIDWEPYRGESFTADFGQTVYGGSFDWQSGVLTVDRQIKTLDGTENIELRGSTDNRYFNYKFHLEMGASTCDYLVKSYCSHWAYDSNAYFDSRDGVGFVVNQGMLYIRLGSASTITTVDAFKALLAEQYAAGTPVQVCYQLATPVTIQLTPREITALSGSNTLYSGTGDTAVTGREDLAALVTRLQESIAAQTAQISTLQAAAVNNA